MTKLTAEYIDDHLHHVHTPESFARGLIYNVLSVAKKSIKTEQDSFETNLKFTVSPIGKLGCIQIRVETPFGVICTHVNV
jgi:hypothetical protein